MPQIKNIDITPGGATPVLYVSQNDVGRSVTVNIKDGAGYYDLTGCSVVLAGTKPSGLGYTVSCTVNGHQVTIETTKQMTDEEGSIASEFKITSGDTVIGTANIILAVERDPHPENTTDGSAEELIPEITVLVERVEAAVAKEEVLHEAEAWAVGQRNGEDVGTDDPTYHNNSKYYKEQAELSKTAAAGSATAAETSKARAATSETNAESAATRAEAAAAAAAQVFTVAGDASFSVDADNDLWLNITIN